MFYIDKDSDRLEYAKAHCFSDFPLVESREALQTLAEERGLLKGISATLQKEILDHGIALRGRPLWSCRYLDRLQTEIGQNLEVNQIQRAARETIDEGKNGLKARLSKLQEERNDIFLRQLCRLVFQCDLLDQPIIFSLEREHRMISEAFAVVRTINGSLAGVLSERIAIDAAIEWFRVQSWDLYNNTIVDSLCSYTNDASAFGTFAEIYLAWVRISLSWKDGLSIF
jgi:hypothetical protein